MTRLFVTTNGPGEVMGWLRPFLRALYAEQRPNETIRVIRPQIHVKDAAYQGQELPESEAVRAVGGSIRFAPHVADRSTSSLLRRLAVEEQR